MFDVNEKDHSWVDSKVTPQPVGIALQPIRLTGARGDRGSWLHAGPQLIRYGTHLWRFDERRDAHLALGRKPLNAVARGGNCYTHRRAPRRPSSLLIIPKGVGAPSSLPQFAIHPERILLVAEPGVG
jgi:hypothetical protein